MVPFIEERRRLKRLRKLVGDPGTSGSTAKRKVGRGNAYQFSNTGVREDLGGIVLRSSWEGNFLRVLEIHGIAWEFEPEKFTFPVKQRRTKSYLPDIRITTPQFGKEWIEVKGYMDKISMTKLRRFKKYYPEEFATLTMVISKYSKVAKAFCNDVGCNVVYYEDLTKAYKPLIGDHWQGK